MGSSKKVSEPSAPNVPTLDQSLQSFLNYYPQMVSADIAQSPRLAQAQMDLINQFGAPTGMAIREANELINPELAKLQKDLIGQVTQGITGNLPDILKDQFLSDLRANVGTNVGSEMGGTEIAKQLFNLGEERRQSFMNPALSLFSQLPTTTAYTPQVASTATSGFTPSTAMGYNQNYANTLSNLYNTQMQFYQNQPGDIWSQMMGGLAGSATGALGSSIGSGIGGMIFPGVGNVVGGALGNFAGGALGSSVNKATRMNAINNSNQFNWMV